MSAPVKQPCAKCGGETKNKKACPTCFAPVVYVPPPKRPKPPLESDVKKRVRKAVIAAGCQCWVHNIDNRFLSTGMGIGTSDLIVIVPPLGRFLAIELKRPGYSPSDVSDAQRSFLASVRLFGGVSGIATCESEALALVAEARQGSPIHAAHTG